MTLRYNPDGSLLLAPPRGVRAKTEHDLLQGTHLITVMFDHKVTVTATEEALARDPERLITFLNDAVEQLATNVQRECERILS